MDSSKDTQKQWLKDRFHETPTSGPEAKKVKFSDVKDELETQFVSAKFSSYTVSHLIRDTFPNTISKPAGKSRQQYVFGLGRKIPISATHTSTPCSHDPLSSLGPNQSSQDDQTSGIVDQLLKCSQMEDRIKGLENQSHDGMVRQADSIIQHKCSETQGPDTIDHLHDSTIDSIITDLRQNSPDLYSLFLKIGDTRRNACDDEGLSTEDIKAVASLCTLLNARSNRVKGL